jgi:hypothetical protein
MLKTRTLLALVLLPLLIFLVACGGDDDDVSDSSGGDQPAATESSGGQDADDDDRDAEDSDDADDDSSSDGDSAELDEEILANCPELINMFGGFAFTNPDSFGEDFDASIEALQTAADRAPDEIKADMQLLADAIAGFFGTLEEFEVDFSNPASLASLSAEEQAELTAAMESFDTPELAEASERLNTYFTEKCS